MPRDDGNLIVTPEQYQEVHADPVARTYLRPFIGAEELLHGKERWCLWLTNLDPADLSRSSLLRKRVDAVRSSDSRAAPPAPDKWPPPRTCSASGQLSHQAVPRHPRGFQRAS
jgi:hypothetical protein